MPSQDFQTFKLYNRVAEEIQKKMPIVGYYLKAFSLNKAVEFLKMERAQGKDVSDGTAEIKQWLQDIEQLKVTLEPELKDKEKAKKTFRDFAFNLFNQSEKEFRGGVYSTRLAKEFLYVSVLFDAWEFAGEPSENIASKKNYANDARFKIMKTLDNGIVPAQTQTQVKNGTSPDLTPNGINTTPTPGDRLSTSDFELTESVFVPKSVIDGPLEKLRQNGQPIQNDALTALIEAINPTQTPNGNNPTSKWGFPMGESVVVVEDDSVPKTPAINRTGSPMPQVQNLGPAQYPQAHETPGMPSNNIYYQNSMTPQGQFNQYMQTNLQQGTPRPQTPTGVPVMPNYITSAQNQQPFSPSIQNYAPAQTPQQQFIQQNQMQGIGNFAPTYPTIGGPNNINYPGNTNNMTPGQDSWNVTFLDQNNNNMEIDKMARPGSTSQYQEAKEFCLKAASEIDFKRVKEAKEHVYKVLQMLEQIELTQNK